MLYEYLQKLEEKGFLKTSSQIEIENLTKKLKEMENVLDTETYMEIEELILKVIDEIKKDFFKLGAISTEN